MARETYKQAYATAKQDLLQQLQKRDDLEQKIRKLKQTVKAPDTAEPNRCPRRPGEDGSRRRPGESVVVYSYRPAPHGGSRRN
jgi:hypothetical protein